MAMSGDGIDISLNAASDLTGFQYRAVRVRGSNGVDIASLNAVHHCIGILQNEPDAVGRSARVRVFGETKAVSGAAVTAGVPVSHNASGYVIAATSGLLVIGQALEAAVNAQDVFRILVSRGAMAQVA
jgi:hypothetical protein